MGILPSALLEESDDFLIGLLTIAAERREDDGR